MMNSKFHSMLELVSATFRKRNFFAAWVFFLALFSAACGAANPLTSDDTFNHVGSLWSDVPAMDGLGNPIDAELPNSIKLFMRTGVNVMMKGLGEGAPEWDWLMFNTNKTSDDVQNFYTTTRMAASPYHWASDASGCVDGAQIGQAGTFCAFTKQQSDKQIGLLIITALDDKTDERHLSTRRVLRDAHRTKRAHRVG